MGHIIFAILHLLAVAFGIAGLIITIPLHLIYAAIKGKNAPKEQSTEHLDEDEIKARQATGEGYGTSGFIVLIIIIFAAVVAYNYGWF